MKHQDRLCIPTLLALAVFGAGSGCRSYAPPLSEGGTDVFYSSSALCGTGILVGSDARLLRWPYVQDVTATSAVLAFGTDAGMWTGTVGLGRDGAYDTAESSTDSSLVLYKDADEKDPYLRLHHAELTGLEPGTEYCYRITAMGEELAGALSFRTAPSSPEAPVRFLVVGDFGAGTKEQLAVRDVMLTYAAESDLLLTLGDNAYSYGDWDEWQMYVFDIYRELLTRVPMFATPGNHDYGTDDAEPYLTNLFLPQNALRPADVERYYSMDWGPLHFVGLDSEKPLTEITTEVDDDERDWLEADLAEADRPWTVAAYHKPVRTNQPGRGPEPGVVAYLQPALEAFEVPLVLQGHNHHYERFFAMQSDQALDASLGGTTYVVSGGGGRGLYDLDIGKDELQAAGNVVHHFLYGTMDACTLTMQAIDAEGTVFDTFTLDRC